MKTSPMRRTFRISMDVETFINAAPDGLSERVQQYYDAFVLRLMAHPALLDRLLRAAAVAALAQARQALSHEYGWDGVSEQALLRTIIEKLEPPAQEYFTEEIEDGVSVYAFDGYGATVTRSRVTPLEEQ